MVKYMVKKRVDKVRKDKIRIWQGNEYKPDGRCRCSDGKRNCG